jgi:hypothetical protein
MFRGAEFLQIGETWTKILFTNMRSKISLEKWFSGSEVMERQADFTIL